MNIVRVAASAVALLTLVSVGAPAQNTGRESFTAFAINMGTIGTGANSSVDITIERWSTDAERDRLLNVFQTQQQEGLLTALQRVKPRVGFIRLPNSVGYDLRYARQFPDDEGGRRIVIATDRRISFREARNQPRSIDYPFTLIEMRLNRDDEGVGKMSIATRITWNKDKNVLELENYNTEPVRLNNIRKRSGT